VTESRPPQGAPGSFPSGASRNLKADGRPKIPVLHIAVDALDWASVVERVQGFVKDGGRHQIITANALMILASEKDQALAGAFAAADLVVPDSAGVLLAARLQCRSFPSQIPGIDLMDRLCGLAAEQGWRVALLGAAPGVAEAAAETILRRHPGILIVHVHHGYFSADAESRVIAETARAAPDLLFVAQDVPRQDGWIHRNLPRLGARVAMGVGGSFDVLAGRLRRSPVWMQKAGFEWLYRLIQEPHRARRMTALPLFLWKALRRNLAALFRIRRSVRPD
jgi:N-acetylglucosaminyldiphosphoundecaprenol N-acetyl-beta-D-mannosaminyltransferase